MGALKPKILPLALCLGIWLARYEAGRGGRKYGMA